MSTYERWQLGFDELEAGDLKPFASEEVREKNYAKDHLKDVLYWLYKSSEFDEIVFERSLEELCAYFDMNLPADLLKRKVT